MVIERDLKPIAEIVYQEMLPTDSIEFKQSHSIGQSTLARIEEMKANARLKGRWLTFKEAHKMENQIHFTVPVIAKKENLPVIKVSELQKLTLELFKDA